MDIKIYTVALKGHSDFRMKTVQLFIPAYALFLAFTVAWLGFYAGPEKSKGKK